MLMMSVRHDSDTKPFLSCVCRRLGRVSDLCRASQLLQDDLTREECEAEPSELTPAVNTDSNSCSSSATNYTDSGAECDKVRRSQMPASRLQPQVIAAVCYV